MDLTGKSVAIIVDNFFEQAEFTGPRQALINAGANVVVLSPDGEQLQGMNHADKADVFRADAKLSEANFEEFDGVVFPGGAVNADHLRMDETARDWLRHFLGNGKPTAIICHAPWLIASAGKAEGRRLTSYYTIQDDMRNAGAIWLDQEVVEDGNLITSRNPADVPAFNQALINKLAGDHENIDLDQEVLAEPLAPDEDVYGRTDEERNSNAATLEEMTGIKAAEDIPPDLPAEDKDDIIRDAQDMTKDDPDAEHLRDREPPEARD